ncbi:uncharacterized protein LTR77_000510 [Saxophila tyrrhenica]|uniref:NTF2-like domain-containing protein n=1 Tax=Saxophila tyrrhenica TaxID=1690608 RepID=A0AAV9PNR2_9PEZI|nr:hypothetical protein LTR77_000510 [Saxophila tyrrhenica]
MYFSTSLVATAAFAGFALAIPSYPEAYGTGSTQTAYQPQPTKYTWPSPPSGPPHQPGHWGPPGSHPGYPGGPSTGAQCPGVQPDGYCLSDEDAEQAADIFRELIQNYSDELALEALTEDFVDWSSAVSIIMNGGDGEPVEIEKPTFVGRQAFMDAQGSQPEIPFKKLQRFHGCNSVSMRWLTRRSANGQPTETARIPVVGNVIIETVQANPGDKYNFRIKAIFSEFNSAAWLVNLGVFVPENGTEGDAGNKRSLPVNLRGPML